MTFWGVLKDGAELLLGEPLEAVLSRDRDAPADQLKAVFPADRLWEELASVKVYEGGFALFGGIVDEQTTGITAAGITVGLVCRSWEALLLDNEAPPLSIRTPSLRRLEEKLLRPLGFSGVLGDGGTKSGELLVEKGESCWTVLERFCSTYLGTGLYVEWDKTVHCEGEPESFRELSGILSAKLSRLPCKQISDVWQQSYRGSYDTHYENSQAKTFRRGRYLSMQSGKSPKSLLERGDRESFQLIVDCLGCQWPSRGARFSLEIPKAGRFENCRVRGARCTRDHNGDRTRLVLERGD